MARGHGEKIYFPLLLEKLLVEIWSLNVDDNHLFALPKTVRQQFTGKLGRFITFHVQFPLHVVYQKLLISADVHALIRKLRGIFSDTVHNCRS